MPCISASKPFHPACPHNPDAQFRPVFLTKFGFTKVNLGHMPPLVTGVNVVSAGDLIYLVRSLATHSRCLHALLRAPFFTVSPLQDISIKLSGESNIGIEAATGPVAVGVKIRDFELVGTIRVVLGPMR